jgi:hypothetical protein
MCHCGQPLHYTSEETERFVRKQIAELGETVLVTVGTRAWLVPRHYLALHGLKGWEIAELGFPEVRGEGSA